VAARVDRVRGVHGIKFLVWKGYRVGVECGVLRVVGHPDLCTVNWKVKLKKKLKSEGCELFFNTSTLNAVFLII
jgi:hypothetical protein